MRFFLKTLFFIFFLASTASAHTSSESFLSLSFDKQAVSGTWAIALRDLEYEIGIDQDTDGKITWAELQDKQKEIERLALSAITISISGESCLPTLQDLLVDKKNDSVYAFLVMNAQCSKPYSESATVNISYNLFFESNPQHRGLLKMQFASGNSAVFVFSPQNNKFQISNEKGSSFKQFFIEGVWHIWIGYDHVLFLLVLLFPAVLVRENHSWLPVEDFKYAFLPVLKVVTAFTIAHSITLALAALQIITLPSRLVESIIAISVLLAAINNFFHFAKAERLWGVAFIFGLIHGFGFAGAIGELDLGQKLFLATVLTFNLGVEAGQLAIVSVFLPFAFFLRRSEFYHWIILRGGSLVVALIALKWTIERIFNY